MQGTCVGVAERLRLLRDVAMIDAAAEEVAGALAPYLLRHVTCGVAVNQLGAPQGARQFYDLRRAFFIALKRNRESV